MGEFELDIEIYAQQYGIPDGMQVNSVCSYLYEQDNNLYRFQRQHFNINTIIWITGDS